MADVLGSRRRARFVGRAQELELFRVALTSPTPEFALFYVYGPGGIGKSSLLAMCSDLAREAGATVVELDGRDLDPTPAALTAALHTATGTSPDEGLSQQMWGTGRLVLLIDTVERLTPLDEWIRTWLLPQLPATAMAVLAGRAPPGPSWRSDPAWGDVMRVMALRNLGPDEAGDYLQRREIEDVHHDRLFQVTHGHPLGLSLVAEITATDALDEYLDPLAPDLVGTLIKRFLDMVPDAGHRRALEVCALARATTEALLRAGLGTDDASELFEWLRGLSFIESRPDGVFPHDLARDALVADLRWRDPVSYQQLFRGISAHIIERLKATKGREQQRMIYNAKYLHRYQSVSRVMSDWASLGQHYPEPATPGDRPAIVELVLRWEGSHSAALVERWLERQPDAFWVVRQPDGEVRGALASLDLVRAAEDDVAADPGCRAAWEYARRHGPPRQGEAITIARFILDRDLYQRPSPTVNCGPILSIQEWLSTPNLSWSFIAVADPERWEDFFPFFDLNRAEGADFEVEDRRYGLFGHDFRRMPVDAWLQLMFERDMTGTVVPRDSDSEANAELLVLSESEFADAVRQALRDLTRPDVLAGSPLVRSRLIHTRAQGAPASDTLARVVLEAAAQLRAHPKDEKLYRALDRTFLRPAPTQERAAEILDLPFSTYRRHLAQGIERIVADLWNQELHAGHIA